MKKIIVFVLSAFMFILGTVSCNDNNGIPTGSTKTQNPSSISSFVPDTSPNLLIPSDTNRTSLSWLLQAVPPIPGTQILYSDIPNLSSYQNQLIPSRQASQTQKTNWWDSIQNYILAGYSYPAFTYLWGFDAVDLEGTLTTMEKGKPLMTLLTGDLDTKAFRKKLKTYQYQEENYLGYSLFSADPKAAIQPSIDIKPPLSDWLPLAFGIIEGIQVNEDKVNLILMTNISDNHQTKTEEILEAKNVIQTALKVYQEKTSLAYQTGGIIATANSLGEVGSAFISSAGDLPFENIAQQQGLERFKSAIGPGKLDPYSELAITLRGDGNDYFLEFILAYDSFSTASANEQVLKDRLSESRSVLTNDPVSEFWIIQQVEAEGSYLRAKVVLIPQESGKTINLLGMITNTDYWFLYAN